MKKAVTILTVLAMAVLSGFVAFDARAWEADRADVEHTGDHIFTESGSVDLRGTFKILGITLTATAAELNAAATAAGTGGLSLTEPFVSTSGGGVLDAGSYGSKMTATGVEMATIATTKESGWTIGYGAYGTVTGEDGYPIGFASLVESTHTTGTKTLQGAQFMAFLGTPGGSQAAHLKTRGGDGTAGMYGLWLKTGANVNCVVDSGARTAPLWVDNQMSGTISGEEYGIFATTGGSKPDAFIGFETTSIGYSQLLYFDETFNSGAGTCVTTDAVPGTQDARILVYYNGAQYYIPLYR